LLLFQLPAGIKDERASGVPMGIWRKLNHLARSPVKGSKLAIDNLLGRSMDMHCVPKQVVLDTLEAAGGRLLDVQMDESAGPEFDGYRYAVVRA